MDKPDISRFLLRLGSALLFAVVLFAQSAPDKILIVNGKTASTAVRQIDGRSYVNIETLAELTNGSVAVEPNRIVLTIPVSNSSAVASGTPVQSQQGLSRGFAAAAIADLAEMREWRGAIGTMITYGLAVSDAWAQNYRAQVQEGLAQAAVAATTDADRNALRLLQNESDQLASWYDGVLADRQALNGSRTLNANALQDDPALGRIRSCGEFLDIMLVSGVFADDSSCQ